MKFKTDRTLATPEAAEKKLLEIANAIGADHACRLSVAAINIRNFEMQAAICRKASSSMSLSAGGGIWSIQQICAYSWLNQAGFR